MDENPLPSFYISKELSSQQFFNVKSPVNLTLKFSHDRKYNKA